MWNRECVEVCWLIARKICNKQHKTTTLAFYIHIKKVYIYIYMYIICIPSKLLLLPFTLHLAAALRWQHTSHVRGVRAADHGDRGEHGPGGEGPSGRLQPTGVAWRCPEPPVKFRVFADVSDVWTLKDPTNQKKSMSSKINYKLIQINYIYIKNYIYKLYIHHNHYNTAIMCHLPLFLDLFLPICFPSAHVHWGYILVVSSEPFGIWWWHSACCMTPDRS